MYYLHNFQPYMDNKHLYPWCVIYPMQLEHIEFAPITIFLTSSLFCAII